ncbi:MarR family winged helix-turn-helix transcriptional regulator [Amnibacterium flavum]|uniref:MarR family transcriptional regulator n=1 Tax=Amnibacterium flavum TaxID=2173173 RepID=A0A2V1HZI4_9MICO|nr:MarR family transcriptional regulator [Amnibacterium flavum]PVZ96174.1 MarR family transcriptional regulator [Amnibacterium flavum]
MAAETKTLGVDQQICFALYSASRSLTARYRDLLAPLGVTYPQYLVLLVLWETAPLSIGAIGERLQLDSGTMSPLVRRLESLGLVERTRTATDERTVLVHLTAAGRDLESLAAGIPDQICAATGLGVEDVVALRDQVADLAENVRASARTAA